jgi:hypothetical protein
MKNFILLCIFSFPFFALGQNSVKGRVLDESGASLPFVNITINEGKQGGTTDLDGYFELQSSKPIQSLHFSYIGFESKSLSVQELKALNGEVVLKEQSTTLQEVTVLPGENPAHRIINNAVRQKDENNPENLPEFSYFSYSKFLVTLDIDSIDPSIDTVMLSEVLDSIPEGQSDSISRIDSSNFEIHQFFSQRHLFFMETLTQRKYKDPRDNEEVLANRTSGFKNPMFSLLVTQLQSFSFYGDYIGISGNEYLNPISKGSTGRYYFILEDSLFTETGDTIFTISFRPRPNKGFKALAGVINIDSRDWAIVNVRANPAANDALPIEIRQEYQRYGPHTWFPISFEADIDLNMVSVNDFKPKAIMRRKLMRINLDPKLNKKDISRTELTIAKKKEEEVDSLLQAFRGEELDSMAANTYSFIDSLSEEENLERNLELLLTLTRGYIPYKFINIDLGKLLNYNVYEGFRLGVGFETNDQLSDWFSLNGYYAYGFGDRAHKYGGGFLLELNKNLRWEVFGQYSSDLIETSGFNLPGLESNSWIENSYRRIYIEQWDYQQKAVGGMRIDPLPNISVELRASHERRQIMGDYLFIPDATLDGNPNPRSQFRFTELGLSLRYAPQEKYAETPFGKIRIGRATPIFLLDFTQGQQGLLGGEFPYQRIMFQADYSRLSRGYGESIFRFRAAGLFGDVPAAKYFSPAANGRNANQWYERNIGSISDRQSFETMRFNEFLLDRFVSLSYRQDFKSTLFRTEKFAPHIEMVHRIALGTLSNPNLHRNIGVKELRNPYLESGLEFNRLLIENFVALGVGIYYRYGAQQLPEPIDNFAFKLTSKFSF